MQDTITAAFARAVRDAPDRLFLDFEGDQYTYAETDSLTNGLAHGLEKCGVGAGDVVATQLDNGIYAVAIWLAANKLGAVSAPINTAFKGAFLQAQLNDCGARILVTEADYADRIEAVAGDMTALKQVFVLEGPDAFSSGRLDFAPLSALLSANRSAMPDMTRPDDVALLVYTSGTTGPSKGCMIPHNMPCNLAWGSIEARGLGQEDILWSPLPLFHLNAIAVTIVTAIVAQCGVAVVKRFSVSNFWPDVARSRASVVSLLGSMASLLAEAPDHEASSQCPRLRIVQAAPFPNDAVEKWRTRFGVDAQPAQGYGMTEACTITGALPGDPPAPPDSSGHGGIDFEVRIVDDADAPLPPGQAGEIVCRPLRPNIIFKGYWNNPEATLKAFKDLWFHTGDIGRMDQDGWLYFVDRKKDYIRRRGENISSVEMEAVFRSHPAIADVAVHAVRSPLGEDDVKVTAELAQNVPVTEEALCRWSIERLPYFAVPSYVEFREALPRSATGKILKEELRREGVTPATWDREAAGLTFEKR